MKAPRNGPTKKDQRVQLRCPAKTSAGTILEIDSKGYCFVEWDAGWMGIYHENELRLIAPAN